MDILVNLILNKNNKYITKTSSNFVNQGINSSQISYTNNAQEKSTEKQLLSPRLLMPVMQFKNMHRWRSF